MKTGLRERFFTEGIVPDCPIYDLHGHWGRHYQIHLPAADPATALNLLAKANVRRLVFCYHGTLFSPDIGNSINIETVQSMPDLLRAYCGINPNYPERTEEDVAAFDRLCPDVYAGFKMLADYHRIPLTDSRYKSAFMAADRLKKIVLLHTWGGSTYNGFNEVKTVAERYPNARILMGHSLHGEWDKAIELAKEFQNVYLELTAVLYVRSIVERFVQEAGSEKVVFGTDFPWFSHYYYIGALLGAGLSDDDVRNILYRNAKRLLDEK